MHRSRSVHRLLLLLVAASLSWQAAAAAEPASQPAAKTVHLLTIGNSFSRNATRFLSELAKAGGHELVHQPIIVGGASLELHATKAQAHEREPASAEGRYANNLSLKDMLRAVRWDFVTIQQASIKSHDLATFQPFATQLRDLVKQQAPQARLLVHETWAYRRDDPRFTRPSGKAGEPGTQEAMYQGLSAAYRAIARELEAGFIPVGDAFFLADSDLQWGYRVDSKFDFQTAQPPALPAQGRSLHMGWRWQKNGDGPKRLAIDGHHANVAGEYLGGCVWYEVLFRESPVGNRFVPPGLEPDYARFLQQTAHRAVTQWQERDSTQSKTGALIELTKRLVALGRQENAAQLSNRARQEAGG